MQTGYATLSQKLLEQYPHGWDDDDNQRIPTPQDVENALVPHIKARVDPRAILKGAQDLAQVKTGKSRRYVPSLLTWLDPKTKGWTASLKKAPVEFVGDIEHTSQLERTKREKAERDKGSCRAPLIKPRSYAPHSPKGNP